MEAGLAQRRRGRLHRLRRRHRAHADGERAAPDGTAKKLVAIRTGQHTTLVAELRAPLGVDSVAGGNTARYCESGGVLLYTVDSTLRNGLGVYKVLDAMPGSTGWGCSDETSISTMGRGQMRGPSHFEVPELGVTFDLTSINADGTLATLKVTRQDTKIAAAPAAGVGAVHHHADRLPAQRARRRDLRVGLRRRHDRQRRERPAHLRHAGPLRGQADRRRRDHDPDGQRHRAVHRHADARRARDGHRRGERHVHRAREPGRDLRGAARRRRSSSARSAPASPTPRRSRPPTRSGLRQRRPAVHGRRDARSSGSPRRAGTSSGTRPRSRAGRTPARARSPATR